jgi:glycosyltransferase involved in cell wall biosynthesis
MHILFLPKYGRKAASSRHRFLQYIPVLESQGIKCTVYPLFSDAYLEKRFVFNKMIILDVLVAFLKRVKIILESESYDIIIIHCEALPYFPAILENYISLRKTPYIYDCDDAIFHQYDLHSNELIRWLFSDKIRKVIAGAAYVIAGSTYLADYARKANNRVVILPTVIDLNRYPIRKENRILKKPFTIGWIGSPSTAVYLKIIAPALRQFCEEHDAKLVLVGSGNVELPGIPLEIRAWSEETEVEEMMQFDVGIMPLPDLPWARGKCAFKLIQYMACRLPVIASPVGANCEVVEQGVNGFLATSTEDWVRALKTLQDDSALRECMGKAGRLKVETQYCMQVTGSRLVSLLQSAVKEYE